MIHLIVTMIQVLILAILHQISINMNEILDNYPDKIEAIFNFTITRGQAPERIDKFLTRSVANATRTRVQKAIDEGAVTVNGQIAKASRKIQPGDVIECRIMKPPPLELIPQDIPLEIKYEDEFLIVVDKPAGMCSHPGFGNRYNTLVNALLYHLGVRESIKIEIDDEEDDETEGEIFAGDSVRPGIVHRLDKDTSGLLVIAKDPFTHAKLAEQFANRSTEREYNALVWGELKDDSGMVDTLLGRSSRDRKAFAVVRSGGKRAITEYHVVERFDYLTLVKYKLHTGRTHQIRVHSSHLKHPIFGDQVYGGDKIIYGGEKSRFRVVAEKCLKLINRQLLHARTLGFMHPQRKEFLRFESELPLDMQNVLNEIRLINNEEN